MSKFALKEVNQVLGKIKFYKLEIDGYCQFDDFLAQIQTEGNLRSQIVRVFSGLNQVANLQSMPKEKFRDLTPKKELIKEYEIKTRDLRVFFVKDKLGHIIIIGGKKSTQDEDLVQMRSIKKRLSQEGIL